VPYESVEKLLCLEACIKEGLRIHSTNFPGLPRLVPKGGLDVCGKFFKEGMGLSVPSYSIHRDKDVWGDDVEIYRPERWFERDPVAIQKTFSLFSFGPR
jgi:benzoate 4-monooxygenase